MALYTKRQFAELVGIPSKDLAVYIKRGHVVLKDEKPCKCPDKKKCTCLIDDRHDKNALFLEKRGAKKGTDTVLTPPETPQPQSETQKTVHSVTNTTILAAKSELSMLHLKRQAEQLKEIENKNRLLEAKIQKAYEENIPRQQAVFLFQNYASVITNVWVTATKRFLIKKGIELSLSREEIIEHTKYIAEIVNEAVQKGADDANDNLRKLARQQAGKKGKGERE